MPQIFFICRLTQFYSGAYSVRIILVLNDVLRTNRPAEPIPTGSNAPEKRSFAVHIADHPNYHPGNPTECTVLRQPALSTALAYRNPMEAQIVLLMKKTIEITPNMEPVFFGTRRRKPSPDQTLVESCAHRFTFGRSLYLEGEPEVIARVERVFADYEALRRGGVTLQNGALITGC